MKRKRLYYNALTRFNRDSKMNVSMNMSKLLMIKDS